MFYNKIMLLNMNPTEWLFNLNALITGGILWTVLMMMLYIIFYKSTMLLMDNSMLEGMWIIIPSLITLILLIPTLISLYNEESVTPVVSLKATGHQWYWSYDYSPINKEFDSFLSGGCKFMLSVDNNTVLPYSSPILISTTSEDVIHSFSLPSFSMKLDANPGKLSSGVLQWDFPGVLSGMCSEICGANHSFMPIQVELVSPVAYMAWLINENN